MVLSNNKRKLPAINENQDRNPLRLKYTIKIIKKGNKTEK